jgi:tRNA(Ile)-lysidine synthase TilS/MesJ
MANRPVVDIYEASITKKFRMKIWSRFVKALKEYQLLKPRDHVCVCISGGKDSMLMARLFMQLKKHSDFDFDVTYLVMNPGYNPKNLELIKHNLELLSIPAKIVDTDIFQIASMQDRSPCFLCAKMRRGALYNIAKSMGCNKIALGHHYDDVIETTLMNMLNVGSFQTMLPKLHSTNYEGMEVIRPMYYIREKDINSWKNYHNLVFLRCACKMTEGVETGELNSQRAETKKLIKELLKYNPQVEKNIFRSASNVTLDMILGYKEGGVYHSFLDDYDKEKND